MSIMNSYCYSIDSSPYIRFTSHRRPLFSISASIRRHHRRRRHHAIPQPSSDRTPIPSSHQNHFKLVIDIPTLYDSSDSKLRQILRAGTEAYDDLRTLISFDEDRRLVVSCRRETVLFMGNLTLLVIVLVVGFRVLAKLGLGLSSRFNRGSDSGLVYRRDRSLGGKQVLVGKVAAPSIPRALKNPVSQTPVVEKHASTKRRKEERRLPSWWPVSLPPPVVANGNKLEYQRMADRLIRAILDQRIIGNDISEYDILQFRRLCRSCDVRVFIETSNARYSFYRAAIDFVLKTSESVDYQSTSVNIDGEDPQQFVAGIAGNIGIEDSHAARIVTAAIAAHTRSCFLQAWALEMQGKHSEAVAELSKICLLHRIFPPEENSPEMEMVGRGLEKHLKLEQRKFLMNLLAGTYKDGNHRSAAEALGLASLPEFGISREAADMV